ncbi:MULTISPECIES: hypothetical protein [Hyphomicrobiales]|jgi:hypothetical protein|uniref:Uncharacterized protein n=1 Tax=Pannonibacter phragmitetus TaxID=121719 RepID=A0A0U3NFD2_9HYPH|nr:MULTISPECIES: hypothetical protein [Hyphomicrobiales]ALV28368.1 hypothetical protein APZ00_15920 [Pannonibacter phragmitetus]KAB2751893.1 hypothetical protein F9L05_01820 [Brucella anthropi]
MNFSHPETFRSIGDILASQVLPQLARAQKLMLRISCLGTISYDGATEADCVDRSVPIGEAASPEDAMALATTRVARGDVRVPEDTLRFRPRMIVIQDSASGLVLAGEVSAGIILWQQPVNSKTKATRIVVEASRLRGKAFAATGRGDHAAARDLRFQASRLEARLVDPAWREITSELLRLPQAA